mmetsp:Transcript_5522/g.14410  ORF Transcript_5522/g.14410 Transcript_5522/m.14410 type:complete len:141 (-) Transcript_5522:349-771(-)
MELRLGRNGVSANGKKTAGERLLSARPLLKIDWMERKAGPVVTLRTLCSVGAVHAGSPAAEAGLLEGDRLLKVGAVDGSSFVSIEESIVPVIRGYRDRPLQVEVQRAAAGAQQMSRVQLTLLPHEWTGNGLLGCVLHPNY